MKQALKLFGIMIAVVCVLSLTVKDRTLFSYVYDAISPATKIAQRGAVKAYDYSAEQTRIFTKKLFDNSVPRVDAVKSKLSSTSRNEGRSGQPAEVIEPEEKEQLDELIKAHR
jgi:hypothetical protein